MKLRVPFAFVALIACGEKSTIQKDTGPAPSSSPSPAPKQLSWAHFPKHVAYSNHRQWSGQARKTSRTTEDASEERLASGERRLTIRFTDVSSSPDETVESVSEHVITNEGLFTLVERDKVPGKEVQVTTHDPPMLRVPAEIADGKRWSVKRYDGATADVILNTGSPFCANGFRTTRRHTRGDDTRSRVTDHYCPDQGWRGQERFDAVATGERFWRWTASLVADGVPWSDPPIGERFPEGAPPEGSTR